MLGKCHFPWSVSVMSNSSILLHSKLKFFMQNYEKSCFPQESTSLLVKHLKVGRSPFPFLFPFVTEKDVKMLKKIHSTSDGHAKHPFVGPQWCPNTQRLIVIFLFLATYKLQLNLSNKILGFY